MSPELRLTLLGGFTATLDNQPISGLTSHKAQALLCYLAVTGRAFSRPFLAGLLWPDVPEANARMNLRKELARLNEVLRPYLRIDRDNVALDPTANWRLDVQEFEALLDAPPQQQPAIEKLTAAVALYQGDFLEGFYVLNGPTLEEWLLRQRGRLRERVLHALQTLAAAYTHQAQHSQAITTLHQLLVLEPWREEAHCQLMRLYAQGGQRAAALAQYELCRQVLAAELAVEPSAETLALVTAIRAGKFDKVTGDKVIVDGAVRPLGDHPVTPSPTVVIERAASRHNLPVQSTTFIGRETEQARITALLTTAPCRLLTLVGPPGIGKTRLALVVAEQMQTVYPDGVYFVPLAAINDPALVASTLVTGLGINPSDPRPPQAKLLEFLHDKKALLLLDNFEQIIPAALLVAEVLAACPGVRVLVTSRERLQIYAEHLYRVPPLAALSAVALFVQRAQALAAEFALTPENQSTLCEICQRLDYLPLAIELSAAQVDLFSPSALLTQMRDQRLDLLSNGPRDLPARQRTLRNAIQSSYNLLHDREQALLRTLSVCVGGFEQAAVEQFGFDRPTLHALINKSLVQVNSANDNTRRFLLLETIREYAREQLQVEGEATVVEHRHAEIYLRLAEEAAAQLRSPEQAVWLERLGVESDNLRAALLWSITNQQPAISARLGIALWRFWYTRGHYTEGWQWLERLLTQVDQPELRAKLFYGRGQLSRRRGDYTMAAVSFAASLALCRELGDRRGIASALRGLGFIHYVQDDYAAARPLFEEALTLFTALDDQEGLAATLDSLSCITTDVAEGQRLYQKSLALRRRSGNRHGITISLAGLAYLAIEQGDYGAARVYQQESLLISQALGNQNGIANSLYILGMIAYSEGDYASAQGSFEKSLKLCQATDDRSLLPAVILRLGVIALKGGAYDQAHRLFEQSLTLYQTHGSSHDLAVVIGFFASLAVAQGQAQRALCLAGAAAAFHKLRGIEHTRLEREEFARTEANARQLLSAADAAVAWAAGQAMTQEQAIAYTSAKPCA